MNLIFIENSSNSKNLIYWYPNFLEESIIKAKPLTTRVKGKQKNVTFNQPHDLMKVKVFLGRKYLLG